MFPKETKILIVDDLKTIRTLIIDFLSKFGYLNLAETGRGESALNLLRTAKRKDEPFGLIFCDWNMPGFNGIDLLNAKNSDPDLRDTPFLMVTVESEKEYVLKAIALGVDDYIVKPFTEKVILEKMNSVWDRLHEETEANEALTQYLN